jgi:redox-sensing transcriptional repressor
VKNFTSTAPVVKRIAESTVRRLSLYLRFLEDFESRGQQTVSSEELAQQGGTTSAQVRKDLSFFGSFGKRGLGYSVPELAGQLREILGLGRTWRVAVIGAGKIGSALVQYRGFRQRGFDVIAVYDNDPGVVGRRWNGLVVRDVREFFEGETPLPDIVVLAVPAEQAQGVADAVVRKGVKAILNFASAPLVVPDDVAVKTVNMAMELETLSYSLVNRDDAADDD